MKQPKPVALTAAEIDQAIASSPLLGLKSRLSRNEIALANKQISTPFAALDAIEALYVAHLKGHSPEQLSIALPDAWGEETIAIPLPVLAALAVGWSAYRNAPAGRTLGECFKIEGVGGQGKRPSRQTVAKNRERFGYAYATLKEYALARTAGTSVSQARAIETISQRLGVGYETVKDAVKTFGDDAIDLLKKQGWWKEG